MVPSLLFYTKYTYTQGEVWVVMGEQLRPALVPFSKLVPLDDHCSTILDIDPPDNQATTAMLLICLLETHSGSPN